MLVLGVCVGAGTAAPRAVHGQWPNGLPVTETVHNLSRTAQRPPMTNMIADYQEACVYCHTPHGGGFNGPVWNRQTPTGPYRMYSSGSMDMITDPQPSGVSLLCLSCHDGTIALDGIINPPTVPNPPSPRGERIERCSDDCHKGGNPDGGLNWENVYFDTDLRDQHPIGMVYDSSRDPSFRSAAAVEAAGLRLMGGKVQCATCHAAHSQQFQPFLRISNTGGSICSACHIGGTGESTAHFW